MDNRVAGKVKNVTKMKSVDLLIEFYRKIHSINLQTANKIFGTIEGIPDRSLNFCKGTVRYRDPTLLELHGETIVKN